MNLEMKKQLTNQKRNFKILNIKYLNADDKKKIQYVANHLNDITVKCVPMKKRMTLNDTITCSINNLKIFGDKCYQEASLFTSLNYVPVFLNHATFTCRVGFQIDEKTMHPNIHSGEVQYFQVPKYLDVSSSVFLSHEFIHGLKETNYEEFILKATLSDVIPIFYELISSENNCDLQSDILKTRMLFLKHELKQYQEVTQCMKNNMRNKDLYRVIQSCSGQYLNSFYYSLILYHMYQEQPKEVLNMVSKVLKKESTTLHLLNDFHIYHLNDNTIFDEEIKKVKKVL